MDRRPFAFRIALACGLAAVAGAAHADVFRCTSMAGAVSYQAMPCAADQAVRIVDVPESYPAANAAERDRIFQREAALDRRLEAERERQTRVTIARISQPVPVEAQAPEPEPEPQVVLFVPSRPRTVRPARIHLHLRPPFFRGG
jgi:hypothetical protein